MSKLTAKAEQSNIRMWHAEASLVLTIEESRALRAELEQAEKEASKKSAYREWQQSEPWLSYTKHEDGEYTLRQIQMAEKRGWNAFGDAAIAAMPGDESYEIDQLRALKEPTE